MRMILLLVVLLGVGCSDQEKTYPIVGVWDGSSIDSSEFFFQKVAYTADGNKCSVGIGIDGNGKLDYGFYISTWTLENDAIHLIVKQSSSYYVPVGEKIVDKLIELDDKKLIVKMIKPDPVYTDGIEKYQRVDGMTPQQVCSIARRYAVNLSEQNMIPNKDKYIDKRSKA